MSVINNNHNITNTLLNNIDLKNESILFNKEKKEETLKNKEEILENKEEEEISENNNFLLNKNISLKNNNIILSADVKPKKNVTYNLGSPNSRFKDIYLSGNTIHIDNAVIKSDDTTITFPSSIKLENDLLFINDGIIIGNNYDSKYVFNTNHLLKSSTNISISNTHNISNTGSSYEYIDTNNEYSRCYLSFSKDSSSEVIGCLTEDSSSSASSTDYYKGSGTYSFRIYNDGMSDKYEIYNNSSTVAQTSYYFTHSTDNIYSIAYLSNEICFFINGKKEYTISSISNKKFKGRIVTSTKASNITTMINFNKITNVVNYYSAYGSLKTVNNTTSLQQYINSSTFLTIPYEGVWDIHVKYFWKTSSSYIRKNVVLKKSDYNESNTTNIIEKGSSSNYYAVNIGNNAYVCDEIFVTVKCSSWDIITFYAATGQIPSSYPLTIKDIRMTATCRFFKSEDFF